jgi:hypothetical protein
MCRDGALRPRCELVAAGSLKVFALLVEMVEVGYGRTGVVRLLHFDAARVGPLACRPQVSRTREDGFTFPLRAGPVGG